MRAVQVLVGMVGLVAALVLGGSGTTRAAMTHATVVPTHPVTATRAATVASASGPRACRPRAHAAACWRPVVATTFAWQLSGTVHTTTAAAVYDVDGDATPRATVRALHRLHRHAVCYVDAGSWERYRDDAAAFPASVRGEVLDGWPDERWLDVRRIDLLAAPLRARMDRCVAKGFDGVEFDNVDGYTQASGFDISATDQLRFNRWLADEAHARGLSAALKNDPDQVGALVRWFDFAVVEQCFQYEECASFSPFVRAGKPVFVAEYDLPTSRFCAAARRLRFTAARYTLALDGHRTPCPWPAA